MFVQGLTGYQRVSLSIPQFPMNYINYYFILLRVLTSLYENCTFVQRYINKTQHCYQYNYSKIGIDCSLLSTRFWIQLLYLQIIMYTVIITLWEIYDFGELQDVPFVYRPI